MIKKRKHIHFMGIGGSGMSAAALIAHCQGYMVSGCDLVESTPYLNKVKKQKIPVFVGHDSK
ncbi:MAG: Mur ligase domain-containing protein, partial [Microgenomates group bacterium]